MRRLTPILIAIFTLLSCNQKKPTIQPNEVVGIWECIAGCEVDYEFYEDNSDYGFYVYSGQRMYTSGKWMLEKNRITLLYDDSEKASYTIELRGDTLIFGKNEMIFVPDTPTNPFENEGTCPLDNLADGFLGYDFTPPQPEEFQWRFKVDESSIETTLIDGYVMETIIELQEDYTPLGEAFSAIRKHLRTLGYESDMYNATERADAYRIGNCVVHVINQYDEWAEDDADDGPPKEVVLKLFYGRLTQ